MQAKLFVCDSEDTYRLVHKMITNTSYEDYTDFDIIVEDVDVENGSSHFNNLVLSYRLSAAVYRPEDGQLLARMKIL